MQSYSKKENTHAGKRVPSSVRALALAAAVFSLPVSEPAMAQPVTQPTTQASVQAECRVEEIAGREPKIVHLNSKNQSMATYYTLGSSAKEGDPKPAIRCSGPAKITVEIFPLINRKKQCDGDSMPLSYSIDGKVHTKQGAVKASDLTVVEYPLPAEIGIAHPLNIEFTIEKGDHELLLLHPAGFLRIVKVEEVKQQPVPQTQPAVVKKKVEKPKEKEPFTFALSAKRFDFTIGKNHGDINELDGFATVRRFGRNTSLVVGTHITSYGLSSNYADGTANFRSASFDLGVGMSFSGRGHTVVALPFAGAIIILPSSSAGAVSKETKLEYGGTLRYSFKNRFGAIVSGSNNPANPLSFSGFAVVPYGWVKDAYPKLAVDLRWIHALGQERMDSDVLVFPMNKNDVLARVMADIPLFMIPRLPLIPSLIGGVELSGNGYNGTFVGGMLSLKAFRMLIDAGAAVTIDKSDHRLIFLLNVRSPL